MSRWVPILSLLVMAACKDPAADSAPPEPQDSPPGDSENVPPDEPADTHGPHDTGIVIETRLLRATSPNGIEAELEVDSLDALGAGVELDELELSFVEDSEGILPAGDHVRDLAGGLFVLYPGELIFPQALELRLEFPDDALAEGENPAQVFAARCRDDLWYPQPVGEAEGSSITVLMQDTVTRCFPEGQEEGPRPPAADYFGVGIGYSDSWVSSVEVDAPLLPGETTALHIAGSLPAGTWFHLAGGGGGGSKQLESSSWSEDWNPVSLGHGVHTLTIWSEGLALWEQDLVVGTNEEPEAYEGLLRAWAPIYEFADGEDFFPTTLDSGFFPDGVDLYLSLSSTRVRGLSSEEVPRALASYGHKAFLLHDNDEPDDGGSITDVTVYGSVHLLDDGRLALQYWTFFVYDSKTWLTGWAAAHARDRESVVVILDAQGQLDEVVYAGHGAEHWMCAAGGIWDDACDGSAWTGGGVRVDASDAALECGRPVVYVAQGSHAQYPRHDEYSISVTGQVGPYTDEWAGGDLRACPQGVEGDCDSGDGYDLRFLPASTAPLLRLLGGRHGGLRLPLPPQSRALLRSRGLARGHELLLRCRTGRGGEQRLRRRRGVRQRVQRRQRQRRRRTHRLRGRQQLPGHHRLRAGHRHRQPRLRPAGQQRLGDHQRRELRPRLTAALRRLRRGHQRRGGRQQQPDQRHLPGRLLRGTRLHHRGIRPPHRAQRDGLRLHRPRLLGGLRDRREHRLRYRRGRRRCAPGRGLRRQQRLGAQRRQRALRWGGQRLRWRHRRGLQRAELPQWELEC
jgi:hypothetical protein